MGEGRGPRSCGGRPWFAVTLLLGAGWVSLPVALPPARAAIDPPTMATFSITACDTAAGIWGVAVASKFLAVGSVVPWARGGIGAVATQAFGNTSFGPRGLDLFERGLVPGEVLQVLLRADPQREQRQIGLVDVHGGAVTYTGSKCQAWAGGKTGLCYAVQGNILTGSEVVEAMAATFESTSGFLGDRMLAALEAGDTAGGDSRGHQSAAIYLACVGQGYGGYNDVLCDLRVDDHASPLSELRRVYNVWRPNSLITEGYKLVEAGKYAEAIALGEQAARLDPDSGQPYYHLACYYARSGHMDKAMYYLQWAIKLDPKWKKSASGDTDLTPLREREDCKRLLAE
jgi:uncharacterized Ntn-hydrolase superfamily protein